MPKAKQTSINIFLRNPVPNDDREEKNQNPDPEVQVNVIQTEDEDADAVPVKKRRTKRSFRNEWLEQFKWLRLRHCSRWSRKNDLFILPEVWKKQWFYTCDSYGRCILHLAGELKCLNRHLASCMI